MTELNKIPSTKLSPQMRDPAEAGQITNKLK